MPRTPRALAGCTLLLLALLAGCGDDSRVAAADAVSPFQLPTNPLDSIPLDSLYGATAVENIRLTPVRMDVLGLPPGWDSLQIAVLSDFHLGLWPDNERVAAAAVGVAARSGADLVVLLGDYIARGDDTRALARVLAPLRGKRVMAVLGERDVRSDSLEAAIKRTLGEQGIQVLDNTSTAFQYGGSTGYVAGISPDLVGEPNADQEWILATMGEGGRTPLLLTHFPGIAPRAPEGKYSAMLAGNTFCGEVEVPAAHRLSRLDSQILPGARVPEAERLYVVDRSVLFVTCGLGYGFVPVRLGAPPEVALVTLRAIGADSAPAADAAGAVPDSLLERFQRQDTAAAAADTTGG